MVVESLTFDSMALSMFLIPTQGVRKIKFKPEKNIVPTVINKKSNSARAAAPFNWVNWCETKIISSIHWQYIINFIVLHMPYTGLNSCFLSQ